MTSHPEEAMLCGVYRREKQLELYDHVRIKSKGLTGTIVDEGISNGLQYYIVELDDQTQEDFLPICESDDLEPEPESKEPEDK